MLAIYDCFCFFNEIDILEARLKLLDQKVDYFVISEAAYTHSGRFKGFTLDSFRDRLLPWWDKIKYIKVYDKGSEVDTWILENQQRNRLLDEIRPENDDVILISDIDEVPFPSRIPDKVEPGKVICLLQHMRYYFADCAIENHLIWEGGTRALSFLTVRDNLLSEKGVKYNAVSFKKELNSGVTLTKVRLYRHLHFIADGGFHLAWMGGVEAIVKKINATSHQEINTESLCEPSHITRSLSDGLDPITGKNIFLLKPFNVEGELLLKLLPPSFLSDDTMKQPFSIATIRASYYFELMIIYARNFARKLFD